MESDDALLERCLERFPELQPADVSHMLSLFRSVVAHAEAAVPANSHELEATCVEAAALFDRVDVDGDGQVDIEELCASLQVCARALAGCSLGTSACAPLTRAHTRARRKPFPARQRRRRQSLRPWTSIRPAVSREKSLWSISLHIRGGRPAASRCCGSLWTQR